MCVYIYIYIYNRCVECTQIPKQVAVIKSHAFNDIR